MAAIKQAAIIGGGVIGAGWISRSMSAFMIRQRMPPKK